LKFFILIYFEKAILNNTDFSNARFENIKFDDVDLSNTKLDNVVFKNVTYTENTIFPKNFDKNKLIKTN